MQKNDISTYSVMERLRDGHEVTIRAIRPEDKDPMADAIKDLSSESFYRRTFAPKRELSDTELRMLADVDYQKVVALVAVMMEAGQDRIVGGGRYIRMGEAAADRAEVAFLIDDAHQGLGIGSRIFKHLVAIARASGVRQFEAEVLPSNEGMLRLFDRSGLPSRKVRSEDTVHVTIDLKASETSRADGIAGGGG